ncbi:hypothetical protein C0Q70_08591 [Pomacea canaliculata]|uniref:Serine aminopeptidase S33 domain-containing protein n=2 Tax=Pomacea canaliculata TaxID=400727 RepID=A0A2T7PIA0_POMCA|nr:protein ABHD15-like isoform X2 [Pomacea canaliculata]PVD33142.1 hypothetical protein C0Q70_08591 [Pomacea canaliculata]
MVVGEDGASWLRAAVALCVMYWLLLSYPLTLALTCLGTLLITVLIYLKRLLRARECPARLTCRDSALARHVGAHCPTFRHILRLPAWARNCHVQSCLGLLACRQGAHFAREYLQLHDGGLLALDWAVGSQYVSPAHPLLLLLPDLTGSAVQLSALCCQALTLGMRAVVINRRGQAGSIVSTPKLPGYGDTSDLREVIGYLQRTHQRAALCAVGVGTGGDALLSYLGQFGSSARLSAAVCISPSYNAADTLHGLPTPYLQLYLSHLKQAVLSNAQVFGPLVQRARGAWSVKEFDQKVVSTCAGYNDLEDFWEDNEPLREADEVSAPVLCVSSLDDPVCRPQHIPYDLFRALPNFFLLTLPHGGHAGFRQGLGGLSWAEAAAMDFVQAMLSFQPCTCYVANGVHVATQTNDLLDWTPDPLTLDLVTLEPEDTSRLPRTLPAEWHG